MSEADDQIVRPRVVVEARLLGTLLLSFLSALGCAFIGWLAFQTGKVYAPIIFFPLAVGALCGGLVVGLCWAFGVNRRPTILAAALFGAVLAVICQHALFYQQHVNLARTRTPVAIPGADEEMLNVQKELLEPPTVLEFFGGRGWRTYFTWIGSAVLTMLGAGAVALFAPLPPTRNYLPPEAS